METELLGTLGRTYRDGLLQALEGVDRVLWIDFPDHANIGDSAIFLGQMAATADRTFEKSAVLPIRAATARTLARAAEKGFVPVLEGGGFFGGMYEPNDHLRKTVASAFSHGRVVQAPQSVAVTNKPLMEEVAISLREVKDLRLFVRDQASVETLQGWGLEPMLLPDAAHCLGALPAPSPVERVVLLAREDSESRGTALPDDIRTVDWPRERQTARRLRQAMAEVAGRTGVIGLPFDYESIARQRLNKGLQILSRGEVVITDRLHAMILGLHLGRRVIAIDNSLQKLRRYHQTWLSSLPNESLTLVDSFSEAIEHV
ncbi:polysaccharide pyruvyl transferase family protein [Microbacterium lacus]|uniref:polysaccharide pyruvyl transferase family protein n=1 Tax=Microbacterium lacus TaxID=415217 RepID=UPI00384E7BCF